ncbi:MAG: site-specific DNA-methyltransferase, partial [Candidatus Eisenbacteria bacterium]|nr:site-specific DNA-methyltransferase [Candidatus Eisenbacteria bacterium]
MAESKRVKITPAKGRPMLTWVGKRPLSHVTAFPAQRVERHDAMGIMGLPSTGNETLDERRRFLGVLRRHYNEACWDNQPSLDAPAPENGGLLFHGDNKDVLAFLLANGYRGKVDLVYIDPPFDSGADYVRKIALRGATGSAKIDGADYTLGEQVQYTDIWANDNYLQFMFERLLLLRELLAENGSICLHCDYHKSHHLRSLLDEALGQDNFESEIVWQRTDAHNDAGGIGKIHDLIFHYVKGDVPKFNPSYTALSEETADRWYRHVEKQTGRRYNKADLTARGLRNGETGKAWRGIDPGSKGNHWRYPPTRLEKLHAEGRIIFSASGMPYLKRYLDESKGTTLQDIWTDISMVRGFGTEGVDYPTQKPEALLARTIESFTDSGDLVLDCFLGSGTTAIVAQKLGRRWIGCDINKGA